MADQSFDTFLQEVKEIEQKDSIYTSEKQIARLLRPGSSYANLNPFEVLLIDAETTPDLIRKQYKKLSILLHPDKNPDNKDRAQAAFDVITKAYKALDDEAARQKALDVVEEARHKVKQTLDEKRKKLRKEGRKDVRIEEDLDPEKYKQAVKVMTMKVSAIHVTNYSLTIDVLPAVRGLREKETCSGRAGDGGEEAEAGRRTGRRGPKEGAGGVEQELRAVPRIPCLQLAILSVLLQNQVEKGHVPTT